jgi:predicted Zn-dependent protease
MGYALGFCYYKDGRYSEAIESFAVSMRGIRDKISMELVALYTGLCFFELGEFREALKHLEQAESMKGDNIPLIDFNIGNCRQGMQDYKAALASYDKSLKESEPAADAVRASIMCQIGSCHVKLGDYAAAINALQETLGMNKDLWNVYNMLGVAYRETGRLDEAVEALKKASELNPQEWRNYNVLGNTYLRMHKDRECAEMLEKALELCDEEQYLDGIKSKLESVKKQLT